MLRNSFNIQRIAIVLILMGGLFTIVTTYASTNYLPHSEPMKPTEAGIADKQGSGLTAVIPPAQNPPIADDMQQTKKKNYAMLLIFAVIINLVVLILLISWLVRQWREHA